MSKHYISCARCSKDIVIKTSNDCYSSEIDGQLVCRECWQKEQPQFLSNKIANLEAKLAESEKEIASLEVLLLENANDRKAMQEFKIGEDEYDLTDGDARNSLCWEVEELKHQLAEKDEQIKYFKSWFSLDENEILNDDYKKLNQDKISFTVEKLEEVKKNIKNCPYKDFGIMYQSDAIRQVDNQIKQLKEGK